MSFNRITVLTLCILLVFLQRLVVAGPEGIVSNSLYPKQDIPFGYGIFEHMHWKEMKNKPGANIENPYLAGALFHIPWAALEPEKGRLDTRMLDDLLNTWSKKGKKIILYIKIAPASHKERNPWVESSTPLWVYEAGGRYVESTKKDIYQRFPLYWDPVFLKEHERFIGELAKRYDGHPGIEFILVGPGAFGTTRVSYPQVIKKFRAAGYTDKKWFETLEKIMDIYKKAFKITPLALGVAPFVKDPDDEDRQYNHFAIAKLAAEKGFYLFYHNLRGTDHWLKSPYPRFFASLGSKTKIALGLDNPSSLNEKLRKTYGDPLTTVQYAFGGLKDLPMINTRYIVLYEPDVEAATPDSKRHKKEYEDAMRWVLERLKKKL